MSRPMNKEKAMSAGSKNLITRTTLKAAFVLALSFSAGMHSQAQTKPTASASSQTTQSGFPTPQEAAAALIKAADDYDLPALTAMFGPDGADLVSTPDPVRDKSQMSAFAEEAQKKNSVAIDPKKPDRATVLVGEEEWPLPIPLVKKGTKWYFDAKAGRREILYRRVGANELDAIEVCRGFVEAQEEYASTIHDDSGVNQYAQRIISTAGKQDGLAWRNPDGTAGGPVGEAVAKAIEEGYASKSDPYHGYYFRVLNGQGPAAPLGQVDYVIEGVMIGGFALVAWPAEYRVTGVQTFIVSYNGIVYQKDLGPDTEKIAPEMKRYNPDKTWHRTDDEW
jgi:Protein of unknown function (DUF2950)